METFVAVLHICVAVVLIALVLLQDSKSGSMGGAFGGGGSNSVFGATGAASLAQQMTKVIAGVFAITCISLTVFSARSTKSVVDSMIPKTTAAPVAPAVPPGDAAATGGKLPPGADMAPAKTDTPPTPVTK